MWHRLYYANMYYLGGISNCLRIFVCTHGYLVADPSIECWGDGHVPLLIIGVLALSFFLVAVPALYAYVLFRIVRRKGHDHPVRYRRSNSGASHAHTLL
jgi:hypothetical protein